MILNRLIFKILILSSLCITSAQYTRAVISSGLIDKHDEHHSRPLCLTSDFNDQYYIDRLDRIRTENPALYQRMSIPRPLYKSATVGDLQTFFVNIDDGNGGSNEVELTAELLAKGQHNAIWADTSEIGTAITLSDAQIYLKALEENTPGASRDSTKGIYDLLLEYFGSPPNKDGDGIVDYLFADLPSGVGGYFSPNDQTDGLGSNKRDMLYIDINMSQNYTFSVIAHELQHLVHASYTRKDLKINEGLSEMAIIICGYGQYGVSFSRYLSRTGEIGWEWNGDGVDYDMGALFTLYYVEQLGDESIKVFLNINQSGWLGFQQLLAHYNTGLTTKDWFMNWFIANYLNDKSINPAYGYDYEVGNAKPSAWHVTGQVESELKTVKERDVNYIYYSSSADSLPITFTSSGGLTPLYKSIEFTDSDITINDLSDNEEYLVYNDTSITNSVVFIVANNDDYFTSDINYKYVSNGKNTGGWTASKLLTYDDGEVDAFEYSGGSFGYLGSGNNSAGQGWGVDFDPIVGENQLIGFSANLGFAQDFGGSTVPQTADKDFDIHIWKKTDDNGSVIDLLPPIRFDGKENGVSGIGDINIDLNNYKDDLTNLGEIVVGIVDDDTIGTYFGLNNNGTGENHTYAYNYNGSGKIATMANFNVGGTSLDGWNFMFRTTWLLKNSTIPKLHAGFMQHSIFTDELKIYIIGNSIVDTENTTVIINNAGNRQVVSSSALASNDSILISNYRLNASGPLDISVSGSYLYSAAIFDTTFNYNVNYTLSSKGGEITSRDGAYSISIPENSLEENLYLIIGKGAFGQTAEQMYLAKDSKFGSIYTVSPVGKELSKGLKIEFLLNNIDFYNVSIGYWDGELWRELPSYLSEDGLSIVGDGTHLGHYTLIPRGSGMPLSITEDLSIPMDFALSQNYPNPFNPETRIHYDLPKDSYVTLTIYDILGRKLVRLIDGDHSAGRFNITWNGKDAYGNHLGSGIYFYQLSTEQFSQTKKMIISR